MSDMPKKIVVLYGGPGTESEVSNHTAEGFLSALKEGGYAPIPLPYKTETWVQDLLALQPDFVLNAMHGCPGEDGAVQATLDMLRIPYQGSGFEASYRAMDKAVAKLFFEKAGVPVAKSDVFTTEDLPENPPFLPLFLKPNDGGSSVDTFHVENVQHWQDVRQKIQNKHAAKAVWMLETYISGIELTVPIVGDKAKGVLEIKPKTADFFNYTAKYTKGMTDYIYPASIATEVAEKAQVLAEKAHKCLGCSGVTRVDFLYEAEKDHLVVLEVNTLPGMTETSLVPKVARGNGMSYLDLICWMIDDGLKRHFEGEK